MKHRSWRGLSALTACLVLAAACSSDSALAPDEPLIIRKIGGDRQIGIAGKQLGSELWIQVWSGPRQVLNAALSFTVTGGGSVDPASISTDGAGRARILWTLGGTGGEKSLTVRSGDAEPVAFTATAVAVEPHNLYYYTNAAGKQQTLGINDAGQFVAVSPGVCSTEGTYVIDGSTITFSILSGYPSWECAALPALTATIGGDAVEFYVWAGCYYYDYCEPEYRVYRRSTP